MPNDPRIGRNVELLPTVDDEELPLASLDGVSDGTQPVAVQANQGVGPVEPAGVTDDTSDDMQI